MVKTTGLIGGRLGYLNGVRPGSELCRQVAVDFESDADFHECRSCPVHSCLQFHNNQQPTLGDVWWQEGGGAAFLASLVLAPWLGVGAPVRWLVGPLADQVAEDVRPVAEREVEMP